METYLYKFSACLLVFWLVYMLFLERQTMHNFKRFYLLGSVVLALVIPLLTITQYIEPIVLDFEVSPLFIPIEASFTEMPIEQIPFWDLETVLWFVYGLGVLLFTIRFVVNLIRMYSRISNNENIAERSFIYVLLKECRIPHSFFKYIFFSKSTYETKAIPKEVLLHEETHAKQLHSIDIIALELLQIVFWFHPLIYILKHHIKLNHEFLADQAVLEQGTDTKAYQKILLQFSSNTQEFQLSSAINYSSIKKRFTVMKTQTSKTRVWVSSLLLLPIIAILFYGFAEKEYVQKENTEIAEAIKNELEKANDLQVTYIGEAPENLMLEYRDFIAKYEETKIIRGNEYERAYTIYNDIMSDTQRLSVKSLPNLPNVNLTDVNAKRPPVSEFNSWKDTLEYALWMDGEPIANSKLNSLSVMDIAYYTGSFVHKNARSEKYPQPYQFQLYTKEGFKSTYMESDIKKHNALTEQYLLAIKNYLQGLKIDHSDLQIFKARIDKLYYSFTKEEINTYNILPAPPLPAQKSISNFQEKPIMWILINRNNQFLVDDEVGTLESIENKLKKLTKEGKTGQLVSIKYDKETSKDIILKVERLIKLNKFKLVSFDASKIPPPPPPSKKTKGGPNNEDTQDIYNPSFLEYIIEMEKEGASFYLDDEKITAKKAKSIANNGKRTEMITQKDTDGKYIVKLSNATKNNRYARSIELKILNDNSYLVDGIKTTKRTFIDVFNQLHQDITSEIRNNIMNIHVTSAQEISNKETWFIYNALQDYGFYRIVTPNQEINRAKGNTPFAIENSFSTQQKATAKQIAEYNAWAKRINNQDEGMQIINKKDLDKYKRIYSIMSDVQRKNAESFPKLPPPPPPPLTPGNAKDKSGPVEINGATYYYSQKNGETTYFDQYGKVVDINKIPPPPPIPNDATPEQKAKMKKATDAYMKANPDKVGKAKGKNGEVFDVVEVPDDLQGSVDINGETFYYTTGNGKTKYFNRYGKEVKMDNLPPPPPVPAAPPEESTLDFVIRMAKANAKFFYKLKPISSDKAIEILKKKPKTNINAQKTDTKQPLIYMSNKPIHIGTKGKSKN